MAAHIDIEFPLPGEVVGAASFFAGGDYNTVGLFREMNGKQEPIKVKDVLRAPSQITCKLYNALGGLLQEATPFAVTLAFGPWSVEFKNIPVPNENCSIRAVLQVGTEPAGGYLNDRVEDVDVRAAAVGGATFTLK